MLDPIYLPPDILFTEVQTLANAFNLQTLSFHIHEMLIAFCFYYTIDIYVSQIVLSRLFPRTYTSLSRRNKINWNIHFVSLVQSTLICILALWLIRTDEERSNMDWAGRIWGYTGAGGLVQTFAMGVAHFNILGWSSLIHALCALLVVGIGFRPFANYYGQNFVLYELSTPFLNIHWFFDKLNMTGSKAQLYNGIVLLLTFFSCRLVWGIYQSAKLYQDIWRAFHTPNISVPKFRGPGGPEWDIFRFSRGSGELKLPIWLAWGYLGTNTILTFLNIYLLVRTDDFCCPEKIFEEWGSQKGRQKRVGL
ncbi:hypothetical protein EAF00_002050 [Botryotinia globosa]|nr:hypothetical protein EAF00_002050 [Botryotinia globosa]